MTSTAVLRSAKQVVRPVNVGWLARQPLLWLGLAALLTLLIACLLAPWVAPYDPAQQDLNLGMTTPTAPHLLGTDQLGRDLLSRLLWAGRTSLAVTGAVLALSLLLGATVGLCAGYFGGLLEEGLMRLVDLFLALPSLLLALALVGALGPSLRALVLALTISWWPTYARLVRSQTLSLRTTDYVLAARALGARHQQIMRVHLLPALIGPVTVQLSLDAGHLILTIAAFGFLGLGVQPPTPEWGAMLVDARPFMQVAPHLVLVPGLAIFCTVFGANALADGVERWLNPWQ